METIYYPNLKELDYKEGWVLKNQCFQTVVLQKTLENLLDSKKIKPDKSKGNQTWIFMGRTDAEAPILWPRDEKRWLTGKDPDAGKDGGQKEHGVTENEMVGMASLTQWTWVWVNKLWEVWVNYLWKTGKSGVHRESDLRATEQQQHWDYLLRPRQVSSRNQIWLFSYFKRTVKSGF